MTTISDLVKKKDGATLKAMALDGDQDAALAFSELVFNAKYAGDASGGKTKKAAKDEAREDAIEFMRSMAAEGSLKALKEWAEMNFEGVREPGKFGGTVMNSFYAEAGKAFEEVLSHPELPDRERPAMMFKRGTCLLFCARRSGEDRNSEVIALWEEGRALKADGSLLCAHGLADLYWKLGRYEEAVECAKEAAEAYPFSHLTLYQAFKSGKGAPVNPELARHHYARWDELTAGKAG
jgi:tetratricopeptide (TPR) repeat protein